MQPVSNSAPGKKWYPNLKGIANPKSQFEVQTADAVQQAFDHIYKTSDHVSGLSTPAAAAQAKAANFWATPYAADTFSGIGAPGSITVTWLGYKIAPVAYVNRKTVYISVPDGSITASGLAGSVTYWFYPAYDTRDNRIVFTVDPALALAGTFAHTAPSAVALMKASSGGNIPLSSTGLAAKENEGPFTGRGGGLLHGLQT